VSQGAKGGDAVTPKIMEVYGLVPFTNTNLGPGMVMIRPRGSTPHFHRLGNYDADKIPAAEQMAGLGASDISGAERPAEMTQEAYEMGRTFSEGL